MSNTSIDPNSNPVKLTTSQREVLRKLSNGERLFQHWYTDKCRWIPKPYDLIHFPPVQQNLSVVNSLHDKGYIKSRNFAYFNSGAYQEIEITEAGRSALAGRAALRAAAAESSAPATKDEA